MPNRIKYWWDRYKALVYALGFYFLADAGDIVTSIQKIPGTIEANPFARDALYQIIIPRILVLKSLALIVFLTFAALVALGFSRFNKDFAVGAAATVIGVGAFMMFFGAVIPNLLVIFGWYQP